VIGLTKATAIEYDEKGIRINVVTPGLILTEMLQSAFDQGVITRGIRGNEPNEEDLRCG
jgi:NAD(P)-dependent dehydrogenase (short-subunit alcohol dehydrogenase family)